MKTIRESFIDKVQDRIDGYNTLGSEVVVDTTELNNYDKWIISSSIITKSFVNNSIGLKGVVKKIAFKIFMTFYKSFLDEIERYQMSMSNTINRVFDSQKQTEESINDLRAEIEELRAEIKVLGGK